MGPSFVRVLASEITLVRFLRRTELVEGRGFEARLIGRSGCLMAHRLDESQVTYRVPLEFITRVNGSYNDGGTTLTNLTDPRFTSCAVNNLYKFFNGE